MPKAPRMEDVEATTRRGMCFTDLRRWEAAVEDVILVSVSRD